MAIPANGYLGNPARTTLEFQTGIDDLVEGINDPASGLAGHNHDADYAAVNHNHDADYLPLTTNAALKSALNAEPTNWVSKWSGSLTSVTHSWGTGKFMIKFNSDQIAVIEIKSTADNYFSSRCPEGWPAFQMFTLWFSSGTWGATRILADNTNLADSIKQIWKAE